jgi:hypothetical protein
MKTNVTIAVAGFLIAFIVSTLAMLLLVPQEAGAAVNGVDMHSSRSNGVGMHSSRSFDFRDHFHQHHRDHHGFGLLPWYGYYDNAPSYPYDDSYSTPQVVVPESPRSACQHSEQTVAVPSANGKTTQVTILRC